MKILYHFFPFFSVFISTSTIEYKKESRIEEEAAIYFNGVRMSFDLIFSQMILRYILLFTKKWKSF